MEQVIQWEGGMHGRHVCGVVGMSTGNVIMGNRCMVAGQGEVNVCGNGEMGGKLHQPQAAAWACKQGNNKVPNLPNQQTRHREQKGACRWGNGQVIRFGVWEPW